MSQTIPLKQVIAELIDAADQSEHDFRRLYRIGVRCARKFNMDIYGSFKSILLEVQPNGIVPWPDDYIDYSMLGVVNQRGECVPLVRNDNLSLLKQQYIASQGKTVQVPSVDDIIGGDLTNVNNYWLNFAFNGTGYVHLYGLGGGTPYVGEFTIDQNEKCFKLAPDYPFSTIMLEYLSDGFQCDGGDYMIYTFAVEAFQWWIRWMRAVDNRKKYSLSEASYFQNQYVIQARQAKMRINKSLISDMQHTFRSHIKLTAKA